MFVSNGQFFVFILCVAFGFASGIVYSLVFLVKQIFSNKLVNIFFDVSFFILLSLIFVFWSNVFNFPSFRTYMPIGVFVGLYFYCESFNIILAKCLKKLYNKIGNLNAVIKKRFANRCKGKQKNESLFGK